MSKLEPSLEVNIVKVSGSKKRKGHRAKTNQNQKLQILVLTRLLIQPPSAILKQHKRA